MNKKSRSMGKNKESKTDKIQTVLDCTGVVYTHVALTGPGGGSEILHRLLQQRHPQANTLGGSLCDAFVCLPAAPDVL
ncbi:hypothetical protein PoB_006626000 [Plakobranchus ocellatus]|uniref:Helicase-associated putative binding domain-containing protein n=1 Tax=Plakobranchus ocellatus TaxID=259542 RepID=A0AAV4D6Q3_9GAST|nr:hypothetical protein PoB_006626000 [Plakobranchus ocellatus]